MTNEELNNALYDKLKAELEEFKENHKDLVLQDDSLHIYYEYLICQDVLFCLSEYDISDERAKALLDSPDSLSRMFSDWDARENNHMDGILETVEEYADELIRDAKSKSNRDAR